MPILGSPKPKLKRSHSITPIKTPLSHLILEKVARLLICSCSSISSTTKSRIHKPSFAKAEQLRAQQQDRLRKTPRCQQSSILTRWTCHVCEDINTTVLLDGEHPLGVLKCTDCNHICCPQCSVPSNLTQCATSGFEVRPSPSARSSSDDEPLPYVSVCTGCGLSHRAVVTSTAPISGNNEEVVYWGFGGKKRKCTCGASEMPWKPWSGFWMRT